MEAKSAVTEDTPAEPAVKATVKGMRILLDLFEKFDIKATLFIEASILPAIKRLDQTIIKRMKKHDLGNHGYAHEDFTGKGTGIVPTKDKISQTLDKAVEIMKQYIGRPTGFRAPYLNFDNNLANIISQKFSYDSSITIKNARTLQIENMQGLTIPEVPLTTGRDKNNKPISTYLWQLLEGNREVEEYLDLLKGQSANPQIPFTVFAIHPWHIAYHIGSRKINDERKISEIKKRLEHFFSRLDNISPISEAIKIQRQYNSKSGKIL